jgi:pilus assembly protein CpaC
VKTRRIGSQIVIDGVVKSEADAARVAQVAGLYPNQVMSLVQVAGEGAPVPVMGDVERYLIRIDFYFVQYDKTSSYALGVGWPGSIGGDATAQLDYDFLLGSARSGSASVSAQPLPRLDIASRHGWAKVLKHATVVTNNDSEAKFSSGGEQNFPVNTGLTIGVQKIPFGTDLTVLAHYDPETQRVDLKLDAQSSDLTSSVAGTSLPGRAVSQLNTAVSLELGQSLVLSGIRSESLTEAVNGLPGLSELPILGFLFGSHSRARIQTEGAIFVIPSVVQNVPKQGAELVNLALKKFESFDGEIDTVKAFDHNPNGGVGVPK